ncbi:MAG: indole-3-glycerol phosphate synthase TrpC [Candidatus Tritonobacter lacicola]|nr:indole-3-glycerol phosphate synthase TrpC [Candidatus Tritonobacter lacicola]
MIEKIISLKREAVERRRRALAPGDPASLLSRRKSGVRDFRAAVRKEGRLSLIAEVKKASPSRGVIRGDFDPEQIARVYREKGVDAISVLTEDKFFLGSPRYLSLVRAGVSVPVLQKDFIVDELQIYEAAGGGADAVLLIAFILSPGALERFISLCARLGMTPLVEVHTPGDISKAADAGADVFGINNRDLKTFTVDLSVTEKLAGRLPGGSTAISESGVGSAQDIERLKECGVHGVLVGEALMASPDIGRKLDELMGAL